VDATSLSPRLKGTRAWAGEIEKERRCNGKNLVASEFEFRKLF